MPNNFNKKRYSGHYRLQDYKAYLSTVSSSPASIRHIKLWDIVDFNKIYTSFQTVEGRSTTRQARQEYCFRRFGKYFGNWVLDVGCDEGIIGRLHKMFYLGVDKYGTPDVRADFNQTYLPFANNSFDTVVCLEVLEHVDDLHQLFSELVRISRSIIIITFPNCWRQLFGELIFGRSSKAEYGLPHERPRDRHKWFFNTEEAESFIAWQAKKYGLQILEIEYVHNIGDLFSFSLRIGRKKTFHYPPHKHWREMNAFTRFLTINIFLLEKFLKLIFLMVGKRGLNISVVNTWFVLRKHSASNRLEEV